MLADKPELLLSSIRLFQKLNKVIFRVMVRVGVDLQPIQSVISAQC